MTDTPNEDRSMNDGGDSDIPSYRIRQSYTPSNRETPERGEILSDPLAVTLLFNNKSRTTLIEWAISLWNSQDFDLRNQSDISDETGLTRKVIKRNANILTAFGILVRNEDYGYPRYGVPDVENPPVEQLSDFLIFLSEDADTDAEYTSLKLFKNGTRLTLVEFAVQLYENGDTSWMSKSRIKNQTGMTRQALIDHLPVMVEFGVLVENNEQAYTRYGIPRGEETTIAHLMNFSEYLTDVADLEELYEALGSE